MYALPTTQAPDRILEADVLPMAGLAAAKAAVQTLADALISRPPTLAGIPAAT
jgi:hypothetical protein